MKCEYISMLEVFKVSLEFWFNIILVFRVAVFVQS